jgi:methionyl-tRNA synthetase
MTASKVPPAGAPTALEKDLLEVAEGHARAALEAWDAIEPHRALERTWAIAAAANQYVDRAAPWAEDKKGNRARVDAILGTLLSVLGLLSKLIWPVLPAKSDEMRKQLGLLPLAPAGGVDLLSGGVDARLPGEALAPGAPLFPTLDEAAARALVEELTPRIPEAAAPAPSPSPAPAPAAPSPATPPAAAPGALSYDQFTAVDLRVGVVRACEAVPKKDKLLKLAVDVGEPTPRTIVAGLALSFEPADLVGRKVVVVANLAPREFSKGLVSHGMLLATGPSDKLVLATVDADAAPGARLK